MLQVLSCSDSLGPRFHEEGVYCNDICMISSTKRYIVIKCSVYSSECFI